MKYIVVCFVLSLMSVVFSNSVFATNSESDPFVLIPKAKEKYWTDVDKLTDPNKTKKFWNDYNTKADAYMADNVSSWRYGCDLGAMLSSGIVSRDTILCLLIRVVKFVANMALVVWSAMIIYAGYLYWVTARSGSSVDETGKANDAIKNAIIGICIVIFSYAIQRIVTQAFLS